MTTLTDLPSVTDETFADEVLGARGTVVVDVWAAWCGPCHQLTPVLADVAAELGLPVVALNADENPVTAAQLRVLGLPTVVVVRDGEVLGTVVGSRPRRSLREQLERVLA
jgi:thioredoxin 1